MSDKNMENNTPRRVWLDAETKAFLSCYNARRDEFQNVRRKKFAFQNILEDLTAMNVMKSPFTILQLENKMKALIRAYKSAKDNEKRTGASPAYIAYEKELDEIFGDTPISRTATHIIDNISISEISNSNLSSTSSSTSSTENNTAIESPDPVTPNLNSRSRKRKSSFEEKKELLLFLNEERNRRHKELIAAIMASKP